MAGAELGPARRLIPRGGELISAVSALALLILMFTVKWFGIVVTPRPHGPRAATPSAENAWHGLVVVRWVMALTIVVALGSVAIHATQRSHGVITDTSLAVTALGCLTTALLSYRVLIDLPSPGSVVDQKLGAILGLLAAAGIALGGYQSLRERRGGSAQPKAPPKARSRVPSDTGTQ